VNGKEVLVATIDTMLSFYLAFLYANKAYFNKDRMLCMSAYLFEVEQKNSLEQKGLLKRFSLDCYGKQPSMEDIRAEKARKYTELKASKDEKEFEKWFLKYAPAAEKMKRKPNAKPVSVKPNKTPSKTVALFEDAAKSVPLKKRQTRRRKKNAQDAPGIYDRRKFVFKTKK
jgi:hypothetical protein